MNNKNIISKDFPTFTDDLKCQLKWLEENKQNNEKIPGIKQQKFLLFYNLFLKANNRDANFNGLCAWKNGPVYTQVHAAIKHHYSIQEITNSIDNNIDIDLFLAKVAKFIVELLTDEEVSEVTHKFDFWKTVDNNYDQNEIVEEYISTSDLNKIKKLLNHYNIDFINQHKIYKTPNATFFIENKDYDFVVKNLDNKLKGIKNDKPIKIMLSNNKIQKKEELSKISL